MNIKRSRLPLSWFLKFYFKNCFIKANLLSYQQINMQNVSIVFHLYVIWLWICALNANFRTRGTGHFTKWLKRGKWAWWLFLNFLFVSFVLICWGHTGYYNYYYHHYCHCLAWILSRIVTTWGLYILECIYFMYLFCIHTKF